MNSIIPFNFKNHSIRVVIDENGNPLFVARDVAKCLGYKDEADAITKHCKHSKQLKDIDSGKSPELRSDTKLIPESDVYRLVMRSKLESAESFQDWVVEGGCGMNQLINVATMSSLEIAELTGKRHADILRDIKNILNQVDIDERKFASVYKAGNGEMRPCFHLPR